MQNDLNEPSGYAACLFTDNMGQQTNEPQMDRNDHKETQNEQNEIEKGPQMDAK